MIKKYLFALASVAFFLTQAFCQNDKALAAFSQSYSYETKADFTKAILSIKDVYDARSYEMNLRLGWLYYEAGQYNESLSYYEKAKFLMPYSIEVKLGLVYPATALANWDKVVSEYKSILETDPQNSSVNYRLGNIYYTRKDYQNAFKCFEKVVNLYPFGYDALLMFAWSNLRLSKMREAKILFNKVLLLSPSDKSALEGLSMIK